jgi:hypothetical protein
VIDLTFEALRAAIRSVIDHSSYTNALPLWFEPETLDYAAMASALQARAERRQKGERGSAFQMLLPRNNGRRQAWALPSLFDQVLLQVTVLSLARALDKAIDRSRVFSFRMRDNTGLGLVEDQASAWRLFDAAIRSRSVCDGCVLQIDLEDAFANIDRPRLKQFLQRYSPDGQADLIDVLLAGFGGTGLPLVNDSTFFLGSAYLSVVDQVVAKYTTNFVRYMDDYKIFGSAQGGLEKVHQAISSDLRRLGFTINPKKTWLGTTEDYVDFLDKVKASPRQGYLTPVPSNIFDAGLMVRQIALTLSDPNRYLTDGVGRTQMAALRRLRAGSLEGAASTKEAHSNFSKVLSSDAALVRRGLELLTTYQRAAAEDWRAVWILYLFRDVNDAALQAAVREQFRAVMRATAETAPVPVVRLWARPAPAATPGGKESIALFDSDYLQAGRLYHGGVK